jgi:hypothetical protein
MRGPSPCAGVQDGAVGGAATARGPVGTVRGVSGDHDAGAAGPGSRGRDRPSVGSEALLELLWIPLGAGEKSGLVHASGRAFEAVSARLQRRARCDLFHSALVARHDGQTFAIEQAPAWGAGPGDRGVVATGPVGLRWLGRSALFRYEVRRWAGGVIPDAASAVGGPQRAADRRRTRRASAGSRPFCPSHDVGAGRAGNRRHVELELAGVVAARQQRALPRRRAAPGPGAGAGMAGGAGRGAAGPVSRGGPAAPEGLTHGDFLLRRSAADQGGAERRRRHRSGLRPGRGLQPRRPPPRAAARYGPCRMSGGRPRRRSRSRSGTSQSLMLGTGGRIAGRAV